MNSINPPFQLSTLRVGLSLLALLTVPLHAFGQGVVNRPSTPDLLQNLGVGSRSVAMGNAFTAIADDASATFWNPGRLGYLRRREAMFETRSVSKYNFSSSIPNFRSGAAPKDPQIGFFSFVVPLNLTDTIGVSYTLGGYLKGEQSDTLTLNGITTNTTQNRIVRNNYFTIAYGTRFLLKKSDVLIKNNHADPEDYERAPKIGFGVSLYVLNQDYSERNTTITTGATSTSATGNSEEKGRGYGFSVGLTYDYHPGFVSPKDAKPEGDAVKVKRFDETYQFGLVYRSGGNISGLSSIGEAFNNQNTARLAVGAAYLRTGKADTSAKQSLQQDFIVSTDLEFLDSGNRSLIDERHGVTNFHLGLEKTYTPYRKGERGNYRIPIRFGFRTVNAAATNYAYDDNVVSFGVGYQNLMSGGFVRYSVEPTVEVFTRTGMTMFTLTGRLSF